jgi:hypothetical protein
VLNEYPERPLEVPLADDQEPVETFGPQEAQRRRSLRQLPGELTSLLGNPGAARARRAPRKMHPPAAELDEEQHMEPLKPDGLDREEVDRDHAVRLRP